MMSPRRRPTRRGPAAVVAVVAAAVLGSCAEVDEARLAPAEIEAAATTTAPPTPTPTDGCGGLPATASFAPATDWLGPIGSPSDAPAGTSIASIRERGVLRVGVSADTLLFGSQNPLTGDIEGFDIDMLRLVAQAIFGDDRDRLEFKVITYAQRIPSLQDGSVDLVAHTMTINCSRWSLVAFSTTYYDAGQKVLVRRDSTLGSIAAMDAAGTGICAPSGSTNIEELAKYPGLDVTAVDDITDCLVLFQQGKVEAVTADDTVLAGFAEQDPYAVVVGDAFTSEPYGVAAASSATDLIRLVNAALQRARDDGTWAQIYERWLGDFGPTPQPPVADTRRPLP